jgi:ubiquinone/menaquinone biosynthesis C-methylase UbiE|tara:strand:- start:67 stop:879 length:813 start_codon:yes stop_codon:yes gene_type:complete
MMEIDSVRQFWEENPLFTGEFSGRDEDLFEEHDRVMYADVFNGVKMEEVFSLPQVNDRVLDLGCGIGFWCSLFSRDIGVEQITGVDISNNSLLLAEKRCPAVSFSQGNAENLDLDDETFDFVNCQGVIHHTPNTGACLEEIFRVLKPGGRGSISVYYENLLVRVASRSLPIFRIVAKLLLRDTGRGRNFAKIRTKDDLTRYYDGADNPIGKSYSTKEFRYLLESSGFNNIEFTYYFFPSRFFRVPIPNFLAKCLISVFPFMIVANICKDK